MGDPVTAEQLLLPEQLAEIVRDNAQDAVMLRTFPVVADAADWKSATQIQKLLSHIAALEQQALDMTRVQNELHERLYQAQRHPAEPRAVPAEFPDSDDKTVRCAFCKSPITAAWNEVRGCCVDGAEWDVGRLENSPPTKGAVK